MSSLRVFCCSCAMQARKLGPARGCSPKRAPPARPDRRSATLARRLTQLPDVAIEERDRVVVVLGRHVVQCAEDGELLQHTLLALTLGSAMRS